MRVKRFATREFLFLNWEQKVFFDKLLLVRCGLYYKLHGSSHPISLKSGKRSPCYVTMPGALLKAVWTISHPPFSHRASPVRDTSPTLAPDSTTQMSYDFDDTPEFRSTSSEIVGALGNPAVNGNNGDSPNNNNNRPTFSIPVSITFLNSETAKWM